TGKLQGQLIEEFEEAGYELHHLPVPSQKLKLAGYFLNFVNFLKSNQFDLIHIHRSDYYWNFAMAARIAGVKSVRTIHNVFKHRWFTKWIGVLNRYTAKKFFNLTFQSISLSVYRNEKEYYGNESLLVKNWYNNSEFFPMLNEEERAMSRKNLGIHRDDFVAITVGRCTTEKKHIDLIKAINELKNDKTIRMLHLGEGVTLQCEKEAVDKYEIQDQVIFCGNQKNVRDYLIASDVFVMTSEFEGLGNAAIEAMACELPLILYDVEGLRELVKDDQNGFLIPSDYRILAQKILFLKKNQDLCTEMGRVSRTIANQEYGMSTGVEEILKMYQPTLSSALKAQY
ncbi:MAG: glycosyltransferase family 4 protein, partial [Flavitalea sp.]